MAVDHWMTFGTFGEKDHFEYPKKGTYRGVIINANMAAYAPAGLAAFLLEKTAAETQYLIDPLTHAFQHDPGLISDSDGNPKASIKALADFYGDPIAGIVGKTPILPEHLEDEQVLTTFVQNCLDYQSSQVAGYMKVSESAKYLDVPGGELQPYALVAPYFFLTESTLDDWLPTNVSAARIALEHSVDKRCFGAVVIDQGILVNPEAIDRIVDSLGSLGLAGFLLWADNLNEQTASIAELHGLIELSRKLRGEDGKEVLNLHGGYFSILAAGNLGDGAMTGVAHGPEFGEYRGVVPVGGGIPISRYYVPKLHARIRYRDAAAMFTQLGALESAELFHERVCDCAQCKETLNGNAANFTEFGQGTVKNVRRKHGIVRIQFPTAEAKLICLRHYLQRKSREYMGASEIDRNGLLNNLKAGEIEYRSVAGPTGVSHLKTWRTVFGDKFKAV